MWRGANRFIRGSFMKSILFLIGYRGTGKTTVGQLLAEKIGWDFVDADVHLESLCKRSIKEIFDSEGETGFRERESQNLCELSKRERCVIATGGGIILREENRTILRENGFVVWLSADPNTIAGRLENDPTTSGRRPNLTLAGGLAEIEQLIRDREPLYRLCADFKIATSETSPDVLAQTILKAWESSIQSTSRSSG